ncbi:hypothetical protein WDW86_07215 [Bdellovibrionota bacterium FG-2]
MKTNQNETKNQAIEQNKERAGFITNVMPVLGKTGEYVYIFLPGEITITEHVNRFKGLLGIEYTPKAPATEKREFVPRLGLQAKVSMALSQDGQWVTIYLPGNMGRIVNHRHAYMHILGLPYEKKSRAA